MPSSRASALGAALTTSPAPQEAPQGRAAGNALMVVGSTSGAGKSTLVSALCRALARRGLDVAPFKAQNMSNYSAVTPDGGEIGRAQAMQALAARVETDARMGPVLLKPSGARTSHLVVMGEEVGVQDAIGYGERASRLRPVVLAALQSLRAEHQVVVLEGAGGAAEINLLDRDLVNLPLAAAAGVPAVLVVDIERGGAFAAAFGTWALLPQRLRACLRGFVINSFRGDVSLLAEGLRELTERTGVPVLGVLPHLGEHLMLGVEDSLDLSAPGRPVHGGADAAQERPVRVAVLRLPHLANPADLDPLVLEPSLELRWATRPGDLADADLIILPGSRTTVSDLAWLRERGLGAAVRDLVAAPDGPHVLGICAGYQMLGDLIEDPDAIESDVDSVRGLGLLPVRTRFAAPKIVGRTSGTTTHAASGAVPVEGYQIRWGRPQVMGDSPAAHAWLELQPSASTSGSPSYPGGPEGCLSPDGRVRGTSLHGILDNDSLRGEFLSEVAAARHRTFVPSSAPYLEAIDAHLDHLADWVETHLDLDHLLRLASTAAPVQEQPGW
ncbi:MAG: cobyric acid synthase [Ornithinimicrobium sp.]|uniref:cobyric acid synthase n=1 Tax=Ornithinimicrobium sp. TaxID=1977084 RepID=UPI0026DEDAF9|nr:cobyric acid synthase [Ornithinimicrobium sp.]MDO5740298.1 cobyric acid synthase [Ornithinimicrobium sp.]